MPATIHAQQTTPADNLSGPDATPNILRDNARKKDPLFNWGAVQSLDDWKAHLKKRTGFDFAPELDVSGLHASSSPGEKIRGWLIRQVHHAV